MKKEEVKLDFVNDKVNILGKDVNLCFTSSGHYTIPLNVQQNENLTVATILMATENISEKSTKEKKQITEKLHKQFALVINLLN